MKRAVKRRSSSRNGAGGDTPLKRRRLSEENHDGDKEDEEDEEAEKSSSSDEGGSRSDSDSDSDSGSDSSDSDSDSDGASGGEAKIGFAANSLSRCIMQNRTPEWILHACMMARHPSMFHPPNEDTPYASNRGLVGGAADGGGAGKGGSVGRWRWLAEVGSRLPQAAMYDMLASSLTGFGAKAALQVLRVLNFPAFLNGQFFVRFLWSGLNVDKCAALGEEFRQFISAIASSEEARSAYGARHVLIRLMARAPEREPMDVVAIEELKSLIVFRRLQVVKDSSQSVEDVNDLLKLGWRPNAGTLVDLAHTESLSKSIRFLAPAVWVDLSATIPMWLDSPYNPSTAQATSLETVTEFWDAVPDYWLQSDNQIRTHCSTLPLPRASKMQLMKPGNLQRMLTLMHKSPTLLRYAWAKKSLTWLNYIKLFRDDQFHTMLQILLQPPLGRAPCLCHIYRLGNINTHRKNRRKQQNWRDDMARDASVAPRSHGCDPNECMSKVLNPVGRQCLPWYRATPVNSNDPDRFDLIADVLPEQKKMSESRYSLDRNGRTIAIAQLLLLLTAKGITATSIQVIAEIVASWSLHTPPTIKELRPILGKMNELAIKLARDIAAPSLPKPTPPPTPPTHSPPPQTTHAPPQQSPHHGPPSDLKPADAAALGSAHGRGDGTSRAAGDPCGGASGGGGGGGGGCGEAKNAGAGGRGVGRSGKRSAARAVWAPSSIQSHVLYKSPKDAPLCNALRALHGQLCAATSKFHTGDLENPKLRELRDIYDSVERLVEPK